MLIRYTRHSRNRMRLWRISEDAIAEVVATGRREVDKVAGRRRAVKEVAGMRLVVVFVQEGQDIRIISVWPA